MLKQAVLLTKSVSSSGYIFVFLIISANIVSMNHRLQAAGLGFLVVFFPPHPSPQIHHVRKRGWHKKGPQTRGADPVPGKTKLIPFAPLCSVDPSQEPVVPPTLIASTVSSHQQNTPAQGLFLSRPFPNEWTCPIPVCTP